VSVAPSGEDREDQDTSRRRRLGPLVGLALAALITGVLTYAYLAAPEETRRLDRILAVLQLDPETFWRQRPDQDTPFFEDTRVRTDGHGFRLTPDRVASKQGLTIVNFGASPSFGWGVDEGEAWIAVLAKLLQAQGHQVRAFNAGQIGYSSHQGRRLVKRHLATIAPDLAVISYLVNDIDRIRFFLPDGKHDRDATPPAAARASTYNTLSGFGPTAFMLKLSARLGLLLRGAPDSGSQLALAHVRVPPAHYTDNLRAIAAMCREAGVPVLFLAMPFRLPEPPPLEPPRYAARVAEARAALDGGDTAGALSMAEALLGVAPGAPGPLGLKAAALEKQGDAPAGQVADMRRKAFTNLVYECVWDAPRYRDLMATVARQLGAPLVDVSDALGSGRKADMTLYVPRDPIHPNAAGHARIARRLLPEVSRLLRSRRRSPR